jgi:hypothetical protein
MKEVLGDGVGLALDCGPGFTVPDAIRFARAVEPLNLLWLEDMITGDYVPYVNADVYREVTQGTSTPIHTGEQIYLRQNFKELIERKAVRVVGPDPCDCGGIAELKWIAEYADLHGILMAPHGTGNGILGLAALVQVCATLPQNFIAFEYPSADPAWWRDIVDGLPDPIVRDGMIEVWDRPGMGVELNAERARPYLSEEDAGFSSEPAPLRGKLCAGSRIAFHDAAHRSSCPGKGEGADHPTRPFSRTGVAQAEPERGPSARTGREAAPHPAPPGRHDRFTPPRTAHRLAPNDNARNGSNGRNAMGEKGKLRPGAAGMDRREFLAVTAGVTAAGFAGGAWAQGSKTGIDPARWTPEYIRSIAGTAEYDTAAECAKVVPLDYKGRLTFWWVGPNQASPQIDHEIDRQFWEAFAKTYPNIQVVKQNLDYNEMLNKLRTAALGKAAPMVAKLPILWGVEFAAKGQLSELGPTDVGHAPEDFWPGALKS